MDLQNSEKKTSSLIKKTTEILCKNKSWHGGNNKGKEKPPNGCFCVYVGVEKQRFVTKAEFANHPLFKMLLEDAELEYGFRNEGPLLIPCEVDLFCRVLAVIMDGDGDFDQYSRRCRFGYGSCGPFSPTRRRFGRSPSAEGYGSYALLTPTKLARD